MRHLKALTTAKESDRVVTTVITIIMMKNEPVKLNQLLNNSRLPAFKKYILYFIIPVFLISQTSCRKESDKVRVNTDVSPKKAGSPDVATTTVSTEKTIQFSGYTWVVRPSNLSAGPGPNTWSSDNAWVDAQGRLHLKISKDSISGTWSCAEVYTKNSFGFGKYQFQVEGRLDELDKNVVIGLFNYSGNDGHDEIDIEFSRWGSEYNPMLNYAVWPKTKSYASLWTDSRDFVLNGTYSTHRFTRAKSSIKFQSLHGFQTDNTYEFYSSTCTNSSLISTLQMPVHMNLWLFRGVPPSNEMPVELIIKSFSFSR